MQNTWLVARLLAPRRYLPNQTCNVCRHTPVGYSGLWMKNKFATSHEASNNPSSCWCFMIFGFVDFFFLLISSLSLCSFFNFTLFLCSIFILFCFWVLCLMFYFASSTFDKIVSNKPFIGPCQRKWNLIFTYFFFIKDLFLILAFVFNIFLPPAFFKISVSASILPLD